MCGWEGFQPVQELQPEVQGSGRGRKEGGEEELAGQRAKVTGHLQVVLEPGEHLGVLAPSRQSQAELGSSLVTVLPQILAAGEGGLN